MKGCWLRQCAGNDCDEKHGMGLMGSSRTQSAGDFHNRASSHPFWLLIDLEFVLILLICPASAPSNPPPPHYRYEKSSHGSCPAFDGPWLRHLQCPPGSL